jgi:RHS repeat-associated protein
MSDEQQSEETPTVSESGLTAFDEAHDAIVDSELPPDPELAERYTALFVAANSGQGYDDYHAYLQDPENRKLYEDYIVSSLGDKGEAYRDMVREALDGLATGRFGFLPDPNQLSVMAGADPVLLFNGEFVHEAEDLRIDGAGIEFAFRRIYRSQAIYSGSLGANWDHAYSLNLREEGPGALRLTTGDLREERYTRHPAFSYFVPPDGCHAIIEAEGTSFVRRAPDGLRQRFEADPAVPGQHRLARIEDRFGNFLQFAYSQDEGGFLERVLVNHPARTVDLVHDELGRITRISDHTGRAWQYYYDDLGDLVTVITPATDRYPGGLATCYEYTTPSVSGALQHKLTRIIDAAGRLYLENEYDDAPGTASFGRVSRQRQGRGETLFEYADVEPAFERDYGERQRPTHETVVTERNGHRVRHVFNRFGNLLLKEECILRAGVPATLVARYRYNRDGHLIGSLSPEGVLTQSLYGRDHFVRRNGIDADDDVSSHDQLTAAERLGFGRPLATVRRAHLVDFETLELAEGVWGDFPNIIAGFDPNDGDIIVKHTYEPDYGQVLTTSDPRFTRSPDPDATDEDPRHQETLTRYVYAGPTGDPHRFLVEIQKPTPTLPDGTQGAAVVESFRNADGTPGYDDRGRLLRRIAASGVVTEYAYVPDDPADPREGHARRTVVDPDGLRIITELEVDELGRVVATRLPRAEEATDGRFVTRTVYNALDQPVETIGSEPFAFKVRRFYDHCGKLEREERDLLDQAGEPVLGGVEVQSFCHDEELNLVEEALGGANPATLLRTRHCYDLTGGRELTILPAGNRVHYRYDERGLLVAQTLGAGAPEAATTRTEYDGDGRVERAFDARGNATDYAYDAFGRVVAEEDALGTVVRRDYDKSGQLVTQRVFERRPDGYLLLARSEFAYDELGHQIRAGLSRFDEPLGPISADELGTAFRDAPGPGRLLVTQAFHDAGGRMIRSVDPSGNATIMEYDALDRVVTTTDPLGNRVELRYDAHGNVVRRDQIEPIVEPASGDVIGQHVFPTAFAYDELDRLVASTDGLGNTTRFAWDSRGNRVEIVDPLGNVARTEFDLYNRRLAEHRELTATGVGDGSPEAIATTRYVRDGNGNAVRVVDALGRRTGYRYDALDRQRVTVFPDGTEMRIAYDPDGHVVRTVDNSGVRRQHRIDALGRTTRVDIEASGAAGVEGATFEEYGYDGLGRRVTEANNFARSETRFDSLGWPVEESVTLTVPGESAAPALRVAREFDDVGAVIALTYPNGRRVRFERDALSRLVRLTNEVDGQDYPGTGGAAQIREIATVEYAGLRQVRCRHGNGATASYARDGAGRLIQIDHAAAGGELLLTIQYAHDAAGNVRLRQEIGLDGPSADRFAYDSLYRLVDQRPRPNVAFDASAFGPAEGPPPDPIPNRQAAIDPLIAPIALPPEPHSFAYDLVGNRERERTDGGAEVTYGTNDLDQYVARDGTVLGYDPNGDLVDEPDRRYAYDSLNRLVRATDAGGSHVARFFHDVRGRRVLEVTADGSRQLVWDGPDLISESRDGRPLAHFVYGDADDDPVQVAADGTEHWYHGDSIGSTRLLTDAAGQRAAAYRYTAFGSLLEADGTPYNPIRYAGRRLDSSLGTYDCRARQYDPTLGRFLQRDPAGAVDGTNRYTYVHNNPMSFTDPFGTDARPEQGKTYPVRIEREGTNAAGILAIPLLFSRPWKHGGADLPDVGVGESPSVPPRLSSRDIEGIIRHHLPDDASLTGYERGLMERRRRFSIVVGRQGIVGYGEQLSTEAVDYKTREGALVEHSITGPGAEAYYGVTPADVFAVGRAVVAKGARWLGSLGSRAARRLGRSAGSRAAVSETERAWKTAAELGFETEGAARGFYSGLEMSPAQVSTYFERLQLGGTIAETWAGAYLNALERQGVKLERWIWDAGSSSYARHVVETEGRATFVRSGVVRPSSTWIREERPILRSGNTPIRVHLRVFQEWERSQ